MWTSRTDEKPKYIALNIIHHATKPKLLGSWF